MNGYAKIKNPNPLVFVILISCLLTGLYFYSSADVRVSRKLGRASDLNKTLEAETEKFTGELKKSGSKLDEVAKRVKEAEREAETVSRGTGTTLSEVQDAGAKISSAISDAERATELIEKLRKTLDESKKKQ
ncbi:MAG: hypothetical protein GX236_02820 [Clostridiaceae bacterium]|nr:hypothetical protein [Clostridiaceae bacterium]